MNPLVLKIVIATVICVWLTACVFLYTLFKNAAWLAGSTVPSCLFFLGAAVAVSFLVNETVYLTPLWVGILILTVLHLHRARRASLRMTSSPWDSTGSPSQPPSSHANPFDLTI